MKLDDYIKQLEDLKSKYGNVEVKINKIYERFYLSINDSFKDPEEPYFDKDQKCVVVYSDFLSYN